MSEFLYSFENGTRRTAVTLPFDLDALLDAWAGLRARMIGQPPPEFSRPEWAYLMTFLDRENLELGFTDAFGTRAEPSASLPTRMARARGRVAVWLPNNVSLLGPLVLILSSLTGNRVRAKSGTRSEDLVGPFVRFLREQAGTGPLAAFVAERLVHEQFDRDDPRNADMARDADLRIVFGSDEGAMRIEALPHPLGSVGVIFSDRRSEVWVDADDADDAFCETLLKVFAIYGRAGCTSPGKVVLLSGTLAEARALRDRLMNHWSAAVPAPAAMAVASNNIMGSQWAAALGWDVVMPPGNGCVLATGAVDLAPVDVPMFLPVVACSLETAKQHLPDNIQTLGIAASMAAADRWLGLLGETKIKRLVTIDKMHHFGPTWDGYAWWRESFEEVEIAP